MLKGSPFEVITILHHISLRIEFRNIHNTAHPFHCTNKEMESQIIFRREGTELMV